MHRGGSSPRVWGQVIKQRAIREFQRIIPTRMGTRAKSRAERKGSQDHPHAYGDKLILILTHRKRLGSSPRVWGQDLLLCVILCFRGIIPTRMGTRAGALRLLTVSQDHPHAYGDKLTAKAKRLLKKGSSPRVWGQEILYVLKPVTARIIPTRMGTRSGLIWYTRHEPDHPHAYGDKRFGMQTGNT